MKSIKIYTVEGLTDSDSDCGSEKEQLFYFPTHTKHRLSTKDIDKITLLKRKAELKQKRGIWERKQAN